LNNGEVTFELLNIRHPVQFRLTDGLPVGENSSDAKTLATTQNLVYPDILPMQIHTSSTGQAGELQIMWVDNSSTIPVIVYGSQNSSMTQRQTGSSSTYTHGDLAQCMTNDMTATRRFIPPGWIHTVLLKGLSEGEFYYRVEANGTVRTTSDVYRHTGPLPAFSPSVSSPSFSSPSSASKLTKVLYLADSGVGPARPDELLGAMDAEGGAINRENAGPSSGGRLVVESILKYEGAAVGGLRSFDLVMHNGDLRC
jgi:hypothetical protein